MTRVLAVDASTRWGSAALVECRADAACPETVAEIGMWVRDSHAEHLLVWVDLLLRQAGWSKASVDRFASTSGPGSFTGIRVGLGTVRGLSLATGKPCHGVVTLQALAEAAGPLTGERLCVMEAGRGDLYGARYDAGSSPPESLDGPWLRPAADVAAALRSGEVVIPAPGTELSRVRIPEGVSVKPAPRTIAAAVGSLAARQDPPAATDTLAPLYLRPPDAILKRRS